MERRLPHGTPASQPAISYENSHLSIYQAYIENHHFDVGLFYGT